MKRWNIISHSQASTHLKAVFFLASISAAATARADVTAVVNDGTLEITAGEAQDFLGEFYGQGLDGIDRIVLHGTLMEDIQISGTLEATIPREGINAIVIDVGGYAGVNLLTLDFDGDIDIDFHHEGRCNVRFSNISGDLSIRATASRAVFECQDADVGGNLTFEGGPYADHFNSDLLFVGCDLRVDTGAGEDFITGDVWSVEGKTFIDLGASSGGDDRDSCELGWLINFVGDVFINGEQGDDRVRMDLVNFGANLFVNMGPGADSLQFGSVQCAPDSMIFLDGGTGNSDELSAYFFEIFDDEYTGFETVMIP